MLLLSINFNSAKSLQGFSYYFQFDAAVYFFFSLSLSRVSPYIHIMCSVADCDLSETA